jgi:hypothetical protein
MIANFWWRLLRRTLHRIHQGLSALAAFLLPVDIDAAAAVLTPRLLTVFERMSRSEQVHGIRVMRALQADGHDDPDLLTAALLHDAGKSRCRLTLPERVLIVLAEAIVPKRVWQWGEVSPEEDPCAGAKYGWRRPFVVKRQHPDWSAEKMLAAGASPLSVALACRHQEKFDSEPSTHEDHLLLLLQEADDAN